MNPNVLYALAAATLFGASTPIAKLLIGELSPVLLGGLLYLGNGIGLAIVRIVRDQDWIPSLLAWSWLLGLLITHKYEHYNNQVVIMT